MPACSFARRSRIFRPTSGSELLRTNISSVFYVGQAVARHMIPRERGKIINIASVQSELARPGIAPYTATKGAVGNLTTRHVRGLGEIRPADQRDRARLFQARRSTRRWSTIPNSRPGWKSARQPAAGAMSRNWSARRSSSLGTASSFVNGHMLYVDGGITACL